MAEMYMMAAMLAARRRAASLKGMNKLVDADIDQALAFIKSGAIDTHTVYITTCLTLGRTIETAIGLKAVPSPSHLPLLLWIVTEIYGRKAILLEPSLMTLMMHIKSACQAGWFSDKDKKCLLLMADQASLGYANIDDMDIEPINQHPIYDIISRFYPRMTVEEILTSFTVRPGEGKSETEFYIAPNTVPNQNVWLLVIRTDNMDTAACLTSPPNADFLINGSGVPQRTKRTMSKRPQLPSNVTNMVKDGVNKLKYFGKFDGEYLITLAYMNLISLSDSPQLQDYVYPMSDDVSSDLNITEEISLICPNSDLRISTPVKGHLCKHLQCFDYKFFMEANCMRPTWKCPLPGCRKPISNLDIRIDNKFLKILNEVPENIFTVFVSEEGSWSVERPSVTTPAVSPPQSVEDSSLLPQGSGDMVNTPSPIQETRPHHLDPVNSAPAQDTTLAMGVKLRRGRKPRKIFTLCESARARTPSPAPVPTPALVTRPASPTRLREPSEDASPSLRMRGGLEGEKLEAALLAALAPPIQPIDNPDSWSIPLHPIPMEVLMARPRNQ